MLSFQKLVGAVFLVAAVSTSVSATITITEPSASVYWVNGSSPNPIAWTYAAGDPDVFSVVVVNADPTILLDPYAVANNVPTANNSITVQTPVLLTGTGYTLRFINISNINDVFATSPSFEIKGAGTPSAAQSSSSAASVAATASTTSAMSMSMTMSTATASTTAKSGDGVSNVLSKGTWGAVVGLGFGAVIAAFGQL